MLPSEARARLLNTTVVNGAMRGCTLGAATFQTHFCDYGGCSTWRLLCSSFLVMTCLVITGHNILPKKELHRSLQVEMASTSAWDFDPGAAAAGQRF